ncbi:glycoside hydrolase family 2 protein [Runella aurantiaca]|uniref:Glycoside hydrolase family 2 n=1 Tax=Runella aurantiaca TaxID=2282308 RepID=A0A369I0Z5_9BACT|nr:sugar-binding domain-containing protein [Runella aurantiaca]RDB03461.1 glycoside hydrolase family 2 [Runella aurantiaca]
MLRFSIYLCLLFFGMQTLTAQTNIPLPEHPRPDWERANWLNLNGDWEFRFDKEDAGLKQGWGKGTQKFPLTIHVPFPWGAPLSGVKDEADIAWYQRTISIPKDWKGQRIFVVIGASDYKTTVWFGGKELGTFEGGYVPFEFELPVTGLKASANQAGANQKLVIRVDDKRREYALYGKQGYGNARGIWQTIYLEARANDYLETLHFTPDIDKGKVQVTATLPQPASQDLALKLNIAGVSAPVSQTIGKGQTQLMFDVSIPDFKLWTLENPHLYEVEAALGGDKIKSYFGMRKISVVNLPGTNFPYVALNNQPIYLQIALDQSYHPEGFYTFPTDEFMKNEIKLAKDIGLNGIRTHIKIDVPRKLYWADKMGLLIMSDLPNFWGQPNAEARAESERVLPQLIKRDFNHPAIFSWILFNETWGLKTKVEENGKKVDKYLPETQQWVASMYRKAKALDSSRLIEDNSICCGAGHTETDINSWHEYLPGYGWEDYLKNLTTKTYEGSTFNFENGYKVGRQPNINSEFGNVWGYDGSSGDVDWTWDYHRSVNTFRKYPLVAGWLYTEHHDVINEWNGYFKFDRTQKFTGLEAFVPGMSLKDLHADIYVTTGQDISLSVRPTEVVQVPLTISSMTGRTDLGNELTLKVELNGWDAFGQAKKWQSFTKKVPYSPWIQQALAPLYVVMPSEKSVAVLALTLQDAKGNILSRNFNMYIIEKPQAAEIVTGGGEKQRLLTIAPNKFSDAKWSMKQWDVLDGLKVNGAGSGYFEYKIKWPTDLKADNVNGASFIMEASAKQLFGKDKSGDVKIADNYMLGGGTFDNSLNPNSYPMTDETKFPSDVAISFNGVAAGKLNLPDDPADHRGVLSWHYQPQNRKLREAGSYGYRLEVNVPNEALQKAIQTGELVLRLAVEGNGGLAIYGEKFGMYPFDPTVIVKVK